MAVSVVLETAIVHALAILQKKRARALSESRSLLPLS
jgi:hypothetical protein